MPARMEGYTGGAREDGGRRSSGRFVLDNNAALVLLAFVLDSRSDNDVRARLLARACPISSEGMVRELFFLGSFVREPLDFVDDVRRWPSAFGTGLSFSPREAFRRCTALDRAVRLYESELSSI